MERELKALNDTQIEIQIPEDSQDGQELLDSWVPIREDKIEAGASPVVAPTGNVYAFFFSCNIYSPRFPYVQFKLQRLTALVQLTSECRHSAYSAPYKEIFLESTASLRLLLKVFLPFRRRSEER